MPSRSKHPHPSSSKPTRPPTKRPHLPPRNPKKELNFGPVEIIADAATPKSSSKSTSSSSSPGPSSSAHYRAIGGKLRRSPTPVLTSLADLTRAHLSQLERVWKETNLPAFEADKRAIAATRAAADDPFDF
eukprot:GFKZ01001509.1.p1 GENE.GFKZ01001509.1~~GFKZ01001509.1.p1  ORF type:complete len:138 (+),score=30.22 GFKZ01001509.1:24-416(+)